MVGERAKGHEAIDSFRIHRVRSAAIQVMMDLLQQPQQVGDLLVYAL